MYLGYLIKVIASLSTGSPPPSGIVCIVSLLLIAAAVVALGAFIFRKKIVKPNQTFPFVWSDLSKQNGQSGSFEMNPPDSENCQPVHLQALMPSETSEDPLRSYDTSGSFRGSADGSRFHIGPDHIPQVNQGWADLPNEELERVTESTDWEMLGGPLSSDYDACRVMPAGVRPGEGTGGEEEDGGEEETQTEGSAEGPDEVSEHIANQEFENSSGLSSTFGYEFRPFIDVDEKQGGSVDMEDEEKSEQSREDPGHPANKKPLERVEKLEVAQPSDYDSTHCIVVDVRPENWDSLVGEEERDDGGEERDEKGQQIKQKLRKPLSD